jgi:hypothetical protein
MALFACSWAVLLPYYGTPDSMGRAELLAEIGHSAAFRSFPQKGEKAP